MTNKTHTAAAVTGTIIYFKYFNAPLSYIDETIILLTASMAVILPDIDNPSSKYGRLLIIVLWPLYLIQKITKRLFPKIYNIIKHKGINHWPIFWIILFVLLQLILSDISKNILTGLYIGVATHLICDYISEGIYLFAPFKQRKYKSLIHIKTGGIAEELIFYILTILNYLLAKK